MNPADSIIDLYRRHGLEWAALRGTAPAEGGWIGRFAALLPLGGSILDIGCGAGAPIAATLIARGFAVTGIDSSAPLLGLCRERLPGGEWIEGDMRCMDLGRRFDGLVAWDSLFHLDHDAQRAMVPRFGAHAAAQAALVFTSGPRHGVALGRFAGETLFHASLDPDEYRALLAAEGFAVVDQVSEDPSCGGRTVWLARRGAMPR